MWICEKCNKILDPTEVTYDETCIHCQSEVITLEEVDNLLKTLLSFHDLNEIANNIYSGKQYRSDKELCELNLNVAINKINKILRLYDLKSLAENK